MVLDRVQIPSSILLIIIYSIVFMYLFIFLFTLTFLLQIMSIEDVERIMDETQEGIEYQRVCIIISIQENNHALQGADTEDELQQDLCKNHFVSHPIFFFLLSKIKSHLHFSADSCDSLH